MSSIATAAQRRRSFLLTSTILLPVLSLSVTATRAQQPPADQLPPIEVSSPVDETRTRAKPVTPQDSGARRVVPTASSTGNPNGTPANDPGAAAPGNGNGSGTAVRQFAGIVGASTTVITVADIARSPAQTLQEIIGQTPGVQLTSLYGGVNGVGTSVDLRGFGAFATANSLLLINGRRVNDIDLQGVDFSTIPRDSIERIEITRGNSGAVLYGDNAVGGVINIVTKTGVAGPPISARVEAGVGSFNQRMGAMSVTTNSGPWSTSFFGNEIASDGYRTNNQLNQRNGVGEVRYTTPDFTAFFNVSGDNQHLGFPGGRLVNPVTGVNELATARSGTSTPFDYGDRQGANATAGFTKTLWNGVDLIVDGGVRDKKQQAAFFPAFGDSYVDSHLQTWSLTPRLSIKNVIFGMPSSILTGIDYYDANFHSERPTDRGLPPIHTYDLSQQTLAGYFQQTIGVLPTTDFSYGARVQQTTLRARDLVNNDPNCAAFFSCAVQSLPLDSRESNHALHVGLEHRFNDVFSVFARAASAFRTPNVDERVASGPAFDAFFNPIPGDFTLKTQTSHDVEGGFRIKYGAFQMQSSIYTMDLTNEIHFDPVNFFNYNLDPTRRYGSETSATYRVNDDLSLRGGFAYTRAVFREGQFAGNDIPLVSRVTANAGVSWNIWQRYVMADATVRYWGTRHMDNDQPNTAQLIPANATVDFKLSGEYQHFFWALSVNNIFNVLYYDYAVASAFTPGAFSAYPLPGRTWMAKAGIAF